MNVERVVFTLSILFLNIFVGFFTSWYITLIVICLTTISISFGIEAHRRMWVK